MPLLMILLLAAIWLNYVFDLVFRSQCIKSNNIVIMMTDIGYPHGII